jgi:hypothetical protein
LQLVQGGTLVTQGGLEMKSTFLKKEAADYGVDAKEELAELARMQFYMETLMENIRRIFEALTEGHVIINNRLRFNPLRIFRQFPLRNTSSTRCNSINTHK